MEALELDVSTTVDVATATAVHELVARNETATGIPGLGEDRLRALDRAVQGDHSPLALVVSVRRQGRSELVGWAQIDGSGVDRIPTMEAVVDTSLYDLRSGDSVLDTLVDAALVAFATHGGGSLRWWMHHLSDADDVRATARGFVPERDLLQFRCPLPLAARSIGPGGRAPASITTRAFRVGLDEAAWLVQNNRAFVDHPEQGQWDLATLEAREAEPWFDPHGFRVLPVDGRIGGSCWTKVHGSATTGEGEIYVIGVDPDFHGRGWGRALAEDGFAWLASRGIRTGMLYVDAANVAAVELYASMGMTVDHVDRSYVNRSIVLPGVQATWESSTP